MTIELTTFSDKCTKDIFEHHEEQNEWEDEITIRDAAMKMTSHDSERRKYLIAQTLRSCHISLPKDVSF